MKNRLLKIFLVILAFALCLISVSAYSTYGAPVEFGNNTTTTAWIGGDFGELNISGSAQIDGNVTASSGLFSWLGSLGSRITKLWATDLDVSDDVVIGDDLNVTGVTRLTGSLYLDDNSGESPRIYFYNELDNESRIYEQTDGDLYIAAAGGFELAGTSFRMTTLTNCEFIKTGATGILSCAPNEADLNVNSSNWWDSLNTPADINAADITDDNTYVTVTGDTMTGNLDMGSNNISASWFKGLFNWIVDQTGLSSKYLNFNGSTLNFSESALNDSIDLRTISTTYNASLISTVSGTLDGGNLTSILVPEDDDTYNVSEAAGANPLIIDINFSNVDSFDSILGRIYYDGGLGHEIQVEIQRSDTGAWENYLDLTDTSDFVNIYVPVFDPEQHVFGNGDVAIRFNHIQSGVPTHNFYIDYLVIVEGWTTLTVADHDALGGRDSTDNHPWALDKNGSKPLTNNWSAGSYNISASGFFGLFFNSTGALEWIRPEHIFDVDDADIETDLNTYWDIAGDSDSGSYVFNFTNSNLTMDYYFGNGSQLTDIILTESDPIFTAWDNFTGIPHATPSDGDTTHFSLADEIFDYIAGLNIWDSSTDLDGVIATDEITELKIDFNTACAAGNHYYLSGNNLACEADDDTTYLGGNAITLVSTTFNFDGGASPSGDLGGTWGTPSVDDDSHAHVYSNIDATTSANWNTRVSDNTGTGAWVFGTSPTFTTGITVPADSISDDELNEGLTFEWTNTHSFAAAATFNDDLIFADEIKPDNALCSNSDLLFKTGADNWDCKSCAEITGSADLCDGDDAGGIGAPIGSIVSWLKNYTNTPALPDGWVECNGQVLDDGDSVYDTQTIPDLNGDNRFLRGNSTSGGTGGSSTHTLSIAEMPAHTHNFEVRPDNSVNFNPPSAGYGSDLGDFATSSAGGGEAHENKPPYYDVVWIMRVK